jgi:hypothetical protein
MKKFKNTLASLLLVSSFLISCSSGSSSWPQSEKDAFMENCVIPGVSSEAYCSCMLDKVLKKYPTPESALNMDYEWMMNEAADCL